MKFLAINGSPRKSCNTATILRHVRDGVLKVNPDAECEQINLYDHDYKGCFSCYECKRLGGRNYGSCAVRDGLTPILEKSKSADCLVFGTPIFSSDATGMMRCYWERLFFPLFAYDKEYASLSARKIHTAFIYTMTSTREECADLHYDEHLRPERQLCNLIFGYKPHAQYVFDTYLFSDYSKFMSRYFSEEKKALSRDRQFPEDCIKAEELGQTLANEASR